MYNNELKKLKSLVSYETWEMLAACNAIVAGGAITSLFTSKDVNDIDVYLRSEADFELFLTLIYEGGFSLICCNMTERSILLRDKKTQQDVQVIVYKFFPTVQDIYNSYDFVHCMGALECKTEKWCFDPGFFKYNSQRYLQFNPGTDYPIISALRVAKYIERGYTISKAQMLRLLLKITESGIDSWEKLKDNISGMYGLNMDTVFPEGEVFSMSRAIEILDEIYSDSAFATKFDTISKEAIFEKYASKIKGLVREDASERWFKNVGKDEGGVLHSTFNPNFLYKIGETVNGGQYGVYAYKGLDVLNGYGKDSDGRYILEVQPDDTATKFLGDKHKLTGDVKVVAGYTLMEFVKKFDTSKKKQPYNFPF